ncbi:MAG: serine hydrolase, partial [Bacteroidia bacterium]
PYTKVDDKLVLLPYANVDNLGPAASVNSCVKDLSNWLMMQLDSGRFEGKRVVPFEALQMTRTSNMIVSDMNPRSGSNFQTYGLGWFMLDYHGVKVIRHDGGADGFVTTTCFVPALNLGIVVLTNTDVNAFYSSLRTQIIDAYMDIPYTNYSEKSYKRNSENVKKEDAEINKMREVVSKTPKPLPGLTQYAGTYYNEVYGKIEIQMLSKVELTLVFSHHPFLTGKLEPMGGNDFLCTYNIATYGTKKISFKVKDEKVKSVTIRVNDFVDMMEYEFVKE